ncbi:hypothetical protein MKQ68_18895 [Chitinophaga horti]|uniref:Uncharacterized protein n=1 Tax=Chitinophaga horti TaxID=2920382 RepID=A0ABY6IY14_9BACT|nr:hypothetical protein [Chitinophaga horti]UYQ92158.1 hypothetical protein MKQ68_18895 [Chitinophaga horti]
MERKIVTLGADKYYVDIEQDALIKVNNPTEIRRFSEIDYTDEGYIVDGHHLPHLVRIDPEGMAAKYGVPIGDIQAKTDYDIIVNHDLVERRIRLGAQPILDISGHDFFVNLNAGYLEPKGVFTTRGISLDNIDNQENGDGTAHAFCYNPKTFTDQYVDERTLIDVPKDVVLIEIPFFWKLDPYGWSREHHVDLKEAFRQLPPQEKFVARMVPWEEIGLQEIIDENRKRLKLPPMDITAKLESLRKKEEKKYEKTKRKGKRP